jgi:hypothetical protein
MLSFIDKEQGKKYTFIANENWIENVVLGEEIFSNDIYKKYNTTITNVSGELVVCLDITKSDEFGKKKIIQETYQEYLNFISQRDFTKEQWVYNILEGISEQDKVMYSDENIVVIPNYTWNKKNLLKMHLLAFPKDKSLHSIRDLTGKHIWLLTHIKYQTLQIIKNIYGFDEEIIKMYIHYAPSTYHLHIHFELISNINSNSSVEYSYELNNVIQILEIKSDFYHKITMNKRT